MSDDITFCQDRKCLRISCPRNMKHIRDLSIPHSFYVETPPDCPKKKKDNNHDIYHVREKIL